MSAGVGRVRVKICGLTHRDDAEMSVALGADALGFNTWPGSKRYVDLDAAGEWIAQLPPFVTRVAVMVNPALDEVRRVASLPFIDAVQLHGHETPEFCAQVAAEGITFYKALAIGSDAPLPDPGVYSTDVIFLDAYVPGQFGGTGQLIDTRQVLRVVAPPRNWHFVLSGGLRPENVGEVIRALDPIPLSVDVASGVERAPGRKDPAKLRAFFEAVAATRS